MISVSHWIQINNYIAFYKYFDLVLYVMIHESGNIK